MGKAPPTRASLLVRLREKEDHDAWGQFVEIYAPLIHAYGLRHGLQDADAADLAQDVLQSIANHADRFDYDPQKGSFGGWLFTVTRNKMRRMITRKKRGVAARGGTDMQRLLQEQPTEQTDEELWSRQHQERLFLWAAERVRGEFQPSTWAAFWQTAVENRAASEVARELRMSVGAVYIAKSRALARLRAQIESVEHDQ